MIKKIVLIVIAFSLLSCGKNFKISINEPTQKEIDGATIQLFLNDGEIYSGQLAHSEDGAIHETISVAAEEGKAYTLKVKVNESEYEQQLTYPKHKNIALSFIWNNGGVLLDTHRSN